MKTRIFQTRFWNDDVVASVSKDANHLWIFLLTNEFLGMTNYVRIPDLFIQNYTKLTSDQLLKSKKELEATGKVFFFESWIYIKNLEKQNNYRNSPRNEVAYQKELDNIPNSIKSYFIDVLNNLGSTNDSSIDSTMHSTHKSEIRNKKPEIRNNGDQNLKNIFIEKYNKIRKFYMPRSQGITIDSKTEKQLQVLFKKGIKLEDLTIAMINMFEDQHHKESNFKWATPELVTREEKFNQFFARGISSNAKYQEESREENSVDIEAFEQSLMTN